ncbi:MAG TPA: hypothetical protein VMF60_02790 [Acidimicrobiales bacterium]|nr:hypothetical protein [Acidimicrobiales bacterium]
MPILPDHLHAVAGRFPDRVALRVAVSAGDTVDTVPGRAETAARAPAFAEMTYAEWEGRADSVARGLVESGLRRGERVADRERPRRIVVTADPLPGTATGTLDKAAIRALLDSGPGSESAAGS